MFLTIKKSNRGSFSKPDIFSCLLPAVAAVMLIFIASAFSQQQPVLAPTQPAVKLSSAQFVGQDGLNIERLIELGQSRRADLLAARQRLAIAEGRLRQAGFRPRADKD